MKRKPLTNKEGDVRELTWEDVKEMRPMREVDPEFLERFAIEKAKRSRGRPQGKTKSAVTISLDSDLIQHLRSSGTGWQSRVNSLLRAAMGLTVTPSNS
jgi:uncharacterized protein (DUF4415 family)